MTSKLIHFAVILLILCLSSLPLKAQKFKVFIGFEAMQVPEKLELLDDTYNWTTIGRSTMALYFLGVERKTSSHLSFGLSINYSNLSTVLYGSRRKACGLSIDFR